MRHRLPDHVSFGLLHGRAVALDLVADRYLMLGPAETAFLSARPADGSSDGRSACVASLERHGLICARGGSEIAPVIADPLQASALEAVEEDGRLGVAEAAIARWRAGLILRRCGLARLVARWRAAREAARFRSDATDAEAAFIARGYARARTYIPARKLCVPDSLALARSLWRRGIDADVFFGVRLHPFMAHAWVQRGGLLLSDRLGTVAEYTPVFRL